MTTDPFVELKNRQREMWASFAPAATFTTAVAAKLVTFAGVRAGEAVLDVGTGTGVAAITARRAGAQVRALDLTPELIERGREDARLAGYHDVEFTVGDAEQLPYPDASFDVVLSQFGHMFAPRPEVTVAEMRRVLKPGGRVAFATWAPELFVGHFLGFVARYSPPAPASATSPALWGNPAVVAERLGGLFSAPLFDRGTMEIPALSLAHVRAFMEVSIGPLQKVIESLAGQPDKLAKARREFEALAEPYYHDNIMRQGYLLTRATAR